MAGGIRPRAAAAHLVGRRKDGAREVGAHHLQEVWELRQGAAMTAFSFHRQARGPRTARCSTAMQAREVGDVQPGTAQSAPELM